MPHCSVQSRGEIIIMIVPHCRCKNSIRRIENRFAAIFKKIIFVVVSLTL